MQAVSRCLSIAVCFACLSTARADEKPVRSFASRGHVSLADLSADGSHAALLANNNVEIWNTARGERSLTIETDGISPTTFAISPEGRRLAIASSNAAIRIWDIPAKTERTALTPVAGDLHPQVSSLRFGPEGKTLTAYGTDNGFDATALWNVETAGLQWCHTLRGYPAINPSGTTVATFTDCRWMVLVDAARGKEVKRFPLPGTRAGDWVQMQATTYSADGRQLAVSYGNGTVVLFNVADQSVAVAFQVNDPAQTAHQRGNGLHQTATRLVFSPDGHYLAAIVTQAQQYKNATEVYELATGKRVAMFPGAAHAIAFAADNRTMTVVGESKTTIWPLFDAPADKSPWVRDDIWAKLASPDPAAARTAMRRVVADPFEASSFLKEKIPAVRIVDAEIIAGLSVALESPAFAVREKATRQFLAFGDAAASPLRRIAEETTSPEVRARVERLLTDVAMLSPEDLRVRRAVTALTAAGTPEAVAVLREWAAGAPGAKLTLAATAAVKRFR